MPDLIQEIERGKEENEARLKELADVSKGVPSIL